MSQRERSEEEEEERKVEGRQTCRRLEMEKGEEKKGAVEGTRK